VKGFCFCDYLEFICKQVESYLSKSYLYVETHSPDMWTGKTHFAQVVILLYGW